MENNLIILKSELDFPVSIHASKRELMLSMSSYIVRYSFCIIRSKSS